MCCLEHIQLVRERSGDNHVTLMVVGVWTEREYCTAFLSAIVTTPLTQLIQDGMYTLLTLFGQVLEVFGRCRT